MKSVFTASDPGEAHLVAGLLEEEGIVCVVEGEMLFGIRGDVGLTASSLPKVCVRDEDAARAVEILLAQRAAPRAVLDDADDAPPPLTERSWRADAKIVVLWVLVGAVSVGALGGMALPVVGLLLIVHLALREGRAS